jgi:hypothetical protein
MELFGEIKKLCKSCNKYKFLSEFGKIKGKEKTYCKSCNNEKNKQYKRSKYGIVKRIYDGQIFTSKRRNYPKPNYTLEELKDWLFEQKLFHQLYDQWENSGYKKELKPSVDRKDDYKSYTFGNIQLMTFRKNLEKAHDDVINGINNKQNKAVLQFTLKGIFIKEFYSIAEAGRMTSASAKHIGEVCSGKRKTSGGFKWKYK